MVKLVDAVDSKSTGSDTVPVRVWPRGPFKRLEQIIWICSFLLSQKKSHVNVWLFQKIPYEVLIKEGSQRLQPEIPWQPEISYPTHWQDLTIHFG